MTSADAPLEVKLTIHNQFSGIELVSPDYGSSDGAKCHLSPDQRVVVGSTTQAGYNIDLTQGKLIGILMYELKDKKQFNKNAISSEDEARCIRLFMIWKVNSHKEFRVTSDLIEHAKGLIWDGGELTKLVNCYELGYIQYVTVEKTYLMHDNTVLTTRVNVTREKECYKLEMTISEGSVKYDTTRLWYYDGGR
jgi:hypothetical protein